jgi:hypothetical protein
MNSAVGVAANNSSKFTNSGNYIEIFYMEQSWAFFYHLVIFINFYRPVILAARPYYLHGPWHIFSDLDRHGLTTYS